MGLISAVRSQMPLPATPPQPAREDLPRTPTPGAVPATVGPIRADALRQPTGTVAMVAVTLAERDAGNHPAAAAARAASEAAREAYIRTSRAAGVNPLPLPRF